MAHGFTSGKQGRMGAPEWRFNGFKNIEEGSELWQVFNDGTEKLIAIFMRDGKDNLRFIKVN